MMAILRLEKKQRRTICQTDVQHMGFTNGEHLQELNLYSRYLVEGIMSCVSYSKTLILVIIMVVYHLAAASDRTHSHSLVVRAELLPYQDLRSVRAHIFLTRVVRPRNKPTTDILNAPNIASQTHVARTCRQQATTRSRG